MTTLQQALHIFRKDVREFRIELGVVFLLTVFLVLVNVQTWETLQERGGFSLDDGEIFDVLLPLVWGLLIARVIHAEALPGDRHFWLTRPYSRAGLILAKALFIAAFVNLPLFVAQALIVSLDGLPLSAYIGSMLWNQITVTAVFLVPIAAVASLTRNLAQFLPVAVLATAVIALPVLEARYLQEALQWVRASIGTVLVGSIAGTVLFLQYKRRKTLRHALYGAVATFAGLVFYLSFPQSAAFAIQSTLSKGRDAQFALKLGQPRPPAASTTTPNRYRQLVEIPIIVEGADPRNVSMDAPQLTFRTLSGVTRRPWTETAIRPQGFAHIVAFEREFYDAARNSPVTVHAEYYLTQYGNEHVAEVPPDGTPVFIPGLGQCGTAPNYDRRLFMCRSAFRPPGSFLSEVVTTTRNFDGWSGPPITISPVKARTYALAGEETNPIAPTAPEPPLRIVSHQPVAYFPYKLDVPNVRLADFTIPEPNREQ
jgi:hypothetical protein